MAPDDYRDNLRKINQTVRLTPSFRSITHDKVPAWLSRTYTEILLLVEDAEIRYVTARYSPETKNAMILAFTDDLIVKAHAAEGDDEPSNPRTSAVRRSTITELEIRSSAGAFDDDVYAGATWPGNLFITVRFSPWAVPIGLPLEETGQSVHKEWLLDTLKSLRVDLLP